MTKERKEHLGTLAVILIGFSVLIYVKGQFWLFALLLPVIAIALVFPQLARSIHWCWMKLAWVMGLVVPKIVLGLLFYFFLFPMALLSRIFSKKDPLMLKPDKQSTFIQTNKQFTKESFEKLW